MATTRPLTGNTGITGGIPGINNKVPDFAVKTTPMVVEVKRPDVFGVPSSAGGSRLEGQLSQGAVKTQETAGTSALWGDASPKATAHAMVDSMRRMADTAARKAPGLDALVKSYVNEFDGMSKTARDGVDFLWTTDGAGLRAQLNEAAAQLAKAAPQLVFPGSVSAAERQITASQTREQLLTEIGFRMEQPRNQWAPKATKEQLQSMSVEQLRTFMNDDVAASRTRQAWTTPLEIAVAEAQVKKDPAAVRAAAAEIVALGAKGTAVLGAMMKFYEGLA